MGNFVQLEIFNEIEKVLTVWSVSSSVSVFSEETATAAETWHHHYDNNYYNGSDQHTNNDADGIAEMWKIDLTFWFQ